MGIRIDHGPFALNGRKRPVRGGSCGQAGLSSRILSALLVLGSAFSLWGCGKGPTGEPINEETTISGSMENMEIISSENGFRKTIFKAPLVEEYGFAATPFQEYRRGMEMIGFDSLEVQNFSVVADYALHWEERDFWELKGNVRVTSTDGRILTNQQLNWDRKLGKIYSNVDSKVEDIDGSMSIGEGFEANDDFSEWVWRNFSGWTFVDPEVAGEEGGEQDGSGSAGTGATGAGTVESKGAAAGNAATKPGPARPAANPGPARPRREPAGSRQTGEPVVGGEVLPRLPTTVAPVKNIKAGELNQKFEPVEASKQKSE